MPESAVAPTPTDPTGPPHAPNGQDPKTPSVPDTKTTAPAPDARKNGKPPEPNKAEAKKTDDSTKTFKLVVKGKEVHVPEDHYHRLAQKGLAADVTLQQFAEYKKAQAALIGALRDPAKLWKVLERIGHDPLKVASEFVYEKGVRREKMSAEARELEDAKIRLAEVEEENKRDQAEKMTQAELAQVAHWQNAYSRDIISAMDSTPELPKTPETVSRLAFHMRQAVRNREEGDDTPIRAADFVPSVLDEFRALTRAFLKSRQGKDMLDLLGDDVRSQLRKAELEAIGSSTPPAHQNGNGNTTDAPTSKKKLSRDEWDELVRKRAGM